MGQNHQEWIALSIVFCFMAHAAWQICLRRLFVVLGMTLANQLLKMRRVKCAMRVMALAKAADKSSGR